LTCRRAHGHALPADSGHRHRLGPVAGGRHEILLAGAGMGSHYPRGYCLLPFLHRTGQVRLPALMNLYIHPLKVIFHPSHHKIYSFPALIPPLYHPPSTVGHTCHFI
jgi:hypothetical protein